MTANPAADLEAAALTIATHYRSVTARETETSIALLVLWTLDALDGGRVTPDDAASILTRRWVDVGNPPAGPDLSEATHELLEEGGWLDEDAIGEASDRTVLRAAAHVVLGTAAA
jgi:hypothetical protein